MAQVHLLIPSFNAGELTPLLGSRFNVEKVQSGCRRLRNFIPHAHGPAFRRPGMEYMGRSAGDMAKSSLRGFNFSTTTGFVLEFHPLRLAVWSNGVPVPLKAGVPLPYTEAECTELQMAQVNDVCYLTHPNHEPRKLVRHADDDWRLEDIPWTWPAMGDENVRSAEIATPTVALLGDEVATAQWPEFVIPASTGYSFSIFGPPDYTSPDSSGTHKIVRLWLLSGGEWVEVVAARQNWTGAPGLAFFGTAPATETSWRITYDQPFLVGGAARVTWTGGWYTLLLDSSIRKSAETVTVPAGEWQMTVECADIIPPSASLVVQRLISGTWTDFRAITLKAGQVRVIRGPTLVAPTSSFRFLWTGRAMTGGVMRFESLTFPASDDVTLAVDGLNGGSRTMTASQPIFKAGHVGSYWQITHRRASSSLEIIADQPTISAETTDPIRVQGNWDLTTYGIWQATLFLEQLVGGAWEAKRTWKSNKDRNVIASGVEDAEVEMRLRVSAGTSEASSGADVPRFVLETTDATVSGIVKVTAVGALDDDGHATTATVDVLVSLYATAATAIWTEGAWSDVKGFPRTVAMHGQRLWFGGTLTEPMRLWGSVVADFENFRRSSLDDGGVSFVPAAQQPNPLQWMISHGENLVLGTNGDEWTMSAGQQGAAITPVSVNLQRRSSYGSRFVGALLLGEVIVFVQRGGVRMRQVAPQADSIAWAAADLTVLAEHVAAAGIVQIAAMHYPQSILWAVTGDGKLLGMTFEQEQNVFAWHVHETDGAVESVAVVFGETTDEVWLQVRRNGHRSIERLDPRVLARRFDDPARLIYLDAAKRVESVEPVESVAGFSHLEGREVSVLGDGAVLAPAVVINGVVTLEQPARVVIAGLPYLSELQPMRLEIPTQTGSAQHRMWRTARVGLYLHDSLCGEVGDGPEARFEKINFRRVATPMDGPPALYTGEKETAIASNARAGVDVIVRTSDPLPLNVGSLLVKGDVFGD